MKYSTFISSLIHNIPPSVRSSTPQSYPTWLPDRTPSCPQQEVPQEVSPDISQIFLGKGGYQDRSRNCTGTDIHYDLLSVSFSKYVLISFNGFNEFKLGLNWNSTSHLSSWVLAARTRLQIIVLVYLSIHNN